jgi:hypothetical protein
MIAPAEAARAYLDGARPVRTLPPSLMIKEIEALRELLRQLLAVIDGQPGKGK